MGNVGYVRRLQRQQRLHPPTAEIAKGRADLDVGSGHPTAVSAEKRHGHTFLRRCVNRGGHLLRRREHVCSRSDSRSDTTSESLRSRRPGFPRNPEL